MLRCKVCGHEFDATKENHYISRDEVKYGFSALAGGNEGKIFDTFDCINCGCQIIVGERKRIFTLSINGGGEDDERNGNKTKTENKN